MKAVAEISNCFVLKRRARDSNPQPVSRHHISSVAANHSLTLRKWLGANRTTWHRIVQRRAVKRVALHALGKVHSRGVVSRRVESHGFAPRLLRQMLRAFRAASHVSRSDHGRIDRGDVESLAAWAAELESRLRGLLMERPS
jgi:hypothetical protein